MAPTMSGPEMFALSPCITHYTSMFSQSLTISQMQERNLQRTQCKVTAVNFFWWYNCKSGILSGNGVQRYVALLPYVCGAMLAMLVHSKSTRSSKANKAQHRDNDEDRICMV